MSTKIVNEDRITSKDRTVYFQSLNPLIGCLAVVIFFSAFFSSSYTYAEFEGSEALSRVNENDERYGYIAASAIWSTNRIQVCWENSSPEYSRQQDLVKDSIAQTWQLHSRLEFTGWKQCPQENFIGIKIRIANDHPHVKGLGTRISGRPDGMVLNFDFDLDGFRNCNSSVEEYNFCVRTIAVHEFGHAIGFAHEHNRLDRDRSCSEPPQGSNGDELLTPYDPDSVMNYCNPKYGNYGKLSDYDKLSVQKVYGGP